MNLTTAQAGEGVGVAATHLLCDLLVERVDLLQLPHLVLLAFQELSQRGMLVRRADLEPILKGGDLLILELQLVLADPKHEVGDALIRPLLRLLDGRLQSDHLRHLVGHDGQLGFLAGQDGRFIRL